MHSDIVMIVAAIETIVAYFFIMEKHSFISSELPLPLAVEKNADKDSLIHTNNSFKFETKQTTVKDAKKRLQNSL